MKKNFVKLIIASVLILAFGQSVANATVNVYDANGQFIGELISPVNDKDDLHQWIVYNPTAKAMFAIWSFGKAISVVPIPALSDSQCPRYKSEDDCNSGGQAYLHPKAYGWLTFCGNRVFRAVSGELETFIPASKLHAAISPFCETADPHTETGTYVKAEEIEKPWSTEPQGPFNLEYVQGGGGPGILPTVQEVPAPAITPNGIIMLGTLLAGAGYFAIRRRKK